MTIIALFVWAAVCAVLTIIARAKGVFNEP